MFIYDSQCIKTKTLVRDLHTTDVRHHLDCWLGVTKVHSCWSGAVVTTISSIIY